MAIDRFQATANINTRPDFGGKVSLNSARQAIASAKDIAALGINITKQASDIFDKKQKQLDSESALNNLSKLSLEYDAILDRETGADSDVPLLERVQRSMDDAKTLHIQENALTPGARDLFNIGSLKARAVTGAQALSLQQAHERVQRVIDFTANIDVAANKALSLKNTEAGLEIFDDFKAVLELGQYTPKAEAALLGELRQVARATAEGMLAEQPQKLLDDLVGHKYDGRLENSDIIKFKKLAVSEIASKNTEGNTKRNLAKESQLTSIRKGEHTSDSVAPLQFDTPEKQQIYEWQKEAAEDIATLYDQMGNVSAVDLAFSISKMADEIAKHDQDSEEVRRDTVPLEIQTERLARNKFRTDELTTFLTEYARWKEVYKKDKVGALASLDADTREVMKMPPGDKTRQLLLKSYQKAQGTSDEDIRYTSNAELTEIGANLLLTQKNVSATSILGTTKDTAQMRAYAAKLHEEWQESYPKIISEIQRFSTSHKISDQDAVAMMHFDNEILFEAIIKASRMTKEEFSNMPGGGLVAGEIDLAIDGDTEIDEFLFQIRGTKSFATYKQLYKDVAKTIFMSDKGRSSQAEVIEKTKELFQEGYHNAHVQVLNNGTTSGSNLISFSKPLSEDGEENLNLNLSDPNWYNDISAQGLLGQFDEVLTSDFLGTSTYIIPEGTSEDFLLVYDTPHGQQVVTDLDGERITVTQDKLTEKRNRSQMTFSEMQVLKARRKGQFGAAASFTGAAIAELFGKAEDYFENYEESVVSIMGSRFQGFETGFEKSETPTDPETWKYVEIPEEASGFTKGKLSKMQTYLDKINAVGDNYDNVTPQDKEEVDIAVAKFKQELENPGKSVTDGSIKSPAKSNQYLRLVDTLDELNKKTLTIINKLGKPGMTVTEIAKLEREWDAFEKQKKFVNSEIDKLEGHKRLTLRPDN